MIHQLYMGKSATFALQRRMQMITDNVANVMTIGHRKRDMTMESLFPVVLERFINEVQDPDVSIGEKKRRYVEFGQAMRISDIEKDLTQGTIQTTNRELDVAINGKGFFQVTRSDGTLAYTRAGNFSMDVDRNLTDASGFMIEPVINIPITAKEIIINEQGGVYVRNGNDSIPRQVGQIFLAQFNNEQYLKSMGQNMFLETDESGEPILSEPGTNKAGIVSQRSLEYSNVNTIEEMVDMLLTQRNFQFIVNTLNGGGDLMKSAISDILPK